MEEIPEENRMYIEVSSVNEIEEAMFLEEIVAEYDKLYQKIEEGMKVEKKLEYMSESGYICSFKRMEKTLIELVTPGDKEGEEDRKYFYLRDEKLIPTLIINLVNKLEMAGQFRFK